MNIFRELWDKRIQSLFSEAGFGSIDMSCIIASVPPDISKGDLAYPMFPFVKQVTARLQKNITPADIARKIFECAIKHNYAEKIVVVGPYLNIYLIRSDATKKIIHTILLLAECYGSNDSMKNEKIMIEFSSPNTNKPLHLGHLRNDILGESISRMYTFCSATVRKVNLINDRGIHICKSMLSYQKFGEGKTPESEKVKSDLFVGNYYVKFNEWKDIYPAAEKEAQEMLRCWERGDKDIHNLWRTMNEWAICGIKKTYQKTGISFDVLYKESETYGHGKDIILEGLSEGAFYKNESGAICVNLKEINLDEKILLRSDGTSVYITQDIGTAFIRYKDWHYDRMIYIVAHEQNYHFKVLFYVLKKLGFMPAKDNMMQHLGYGMVHLPEGRMKSREGTVVDADVLLQNIRHLVKKEIMQREKSEHVQGIDTICHNVALGALHYYLLGTHPKKDIVFNAETSISFTGNTGPYLQYTCARISTMLKKFGISDEISEEEHWDESISDTEWKLTFCLLRFPDVVRQSSQKQDPSLLAQYLYTCASLFSTFYQNMPIAKCKDITSKVSRIYISKAVLHVMRNGMELLNIPFIEKM